MRNDFYKSLQSIQEIQKSFNRALEPHRSYIEQFNKLYSNHFESINLAKSLVPNWNDYTFTNQIQGMTNLLSSFADISRTAYTPLAEHSAQIAKALNPLLLEIKNCQAIYERTNQLTRTFSHILEDTPTIQDSSNLFDDITFDDGYVELGDESFDALDSLLHEAELPSSNEVPIAKRMTISDFLTIISIVITLLSMLQVSHYRKIDTQKAQLESQTESTERRLYEEEMLKLHQQQNANFENLCNKINDFLEYAEPYLEHQLSEFESLQAEPELPECEAENLEADFQFEESPDNTVVSDVDADVPNEN